MSAKEKPTTVRFDSKSAKRLEVLKENLKLNSKTEVIQLALKTLSVLADMADDQNRVTLEMGDKTVLLYLD